MALNDAVEDMEKKRLQLSLPYVLGGYYPTYSLLVAGTFLVVSLALAVGCAPHPDEAPLLLFRSFTAFCATSVSLLMASTLFYRVCGGSYAFSSQNVARQVDWCYEVLLKENAQKVVPWLANCTRAERVCVVAAVAVVGEVGKVLPWWSFVACASAGWIGFLLLRVFLWPK